MVDMLQAELLLRSQIPFAELKSAYVASKRENITYKLSTGVQINVPLRSILSSEGACQSRACSVGKS